MAEQIIKRGGNVAARKDATNNLVRIGTLKSEYMTWKGKLRDREIDLKHERAKQASVNDTLSKAQDELSKVEEIIDCDPLPEGAQPKARLQKRDKLKYQISQLEASLNAQKQCTQKAMDSVSVAEQSLFDADSKLNAMVDTLKDTEAVLKLQKELDGERSSRLANLERKNVKRWEKEQKTLIREKEDEISRLTDLAQTQVDTTMAIHRNVVDRMQDQQLLAKEVREQTQLNHDETHRRRTEAVMELKTHSDAISAEVAGDAAQNVMKREAALKKLEDEKESMIAKGINPYQAFRQREIDEDAIQREKRLKKAVEHNKKSLASDMQREEKYTRKVDAKTAHDKAYERKFRDALGRTVVEGNNAGYLDKITIGHKQLLDPSGRMARVNPSQVTEIADMSLGLGKSEKVPEHIRRDIIKRLQSELNVNDDTYGEFQRLVNAHLPPDERRAIEGSSSFGKSKESSMRRSVSLDALEDESEEVAAARRAQERRLAELHELGAESGPMPGVNKAAMTINMPEMEYEKDDLIKLATENGRNLGGKMIADNDKSPKYATVQLTKFEKDSLARAQQRQRDRTELGVTQVAGGRVFKGQSFVPKPAEILYKDFEVGKVYKKRFTMTNASYTFNTFKLMPLTDDIVDFFTISYEKPGRMSAGVSCPIDIVFSPQIPKDINSFIPFLTETGPVNVPLTCLVKRCKPKLQTTYVDFGGVVIGQRETQTIEIKNTEALPAVFNVVPMSIEYVDGEPVRHGSFREAMEIASTANAQEQDPIAVDADLPDVSKISEQESAALGDVMMDGETVPVAPPTAESIAEFTKPLDDEEIGSIPASSEDDLDKRLNLITTATLRRKLLETPYPLSINEKIGMVEGYDIANFTILCSPLEVGAVKRKFKIVFSPPEVELSGPVKGKKDKKGMENENMARMIATASQPADKEQIIDVSVAGKQVPIFVETEEIDLKCTLFGRIYRRRVTVCNRGQITERVEIKIPPPMNKFVEVSPSMAFVQSGGSQDINLKFSPRREIFKVLAHYSFPNDAYDEAALMKIPLKIDVLGQDLPVWFSIKSDVCSSKLELSSKKIELGNQYLHQKSSYQLTVRNTSLQAQKIGFVKLPKEVTVEPHEGFIVILPNESEVFEVSFQPRSAISYDLKLVLQSSLNDTYIVNLTATGIECPISFTSTNIAMKSTCPGERVLANVLCSNTTRKQQTFEIVSPHPRFSWLKVSPSIVDLKPGGTARVEFEYTPPEDAMSLDPKGWHSDMMKASLVAPEGSTDGTSARSTKKGGKESRKSSVSSKASGATSVSDSESKPPEFRRASLGLNAGMVGSPFSDWTDDGSWAYGSGLLGDIMWKKASVIQEKQPAIMEADDEEGGENDLDASDDDSFSQAREVEEDWGIASAWRLPLFIKPTQKEKNSDATGLPASPRRHTVQAPTAMLFISVKTAVVAPTLEVDNKDVNFGQVALGTRLLKVIKIKNTSQAPIRLHASGLNACGPFTMLNCTREIPPGEFKNVVIEYFPKRSGLTIEYLELNPSAFKGGQSVRLKCSGEGLQPAIELKGLSSPPTAWKSPQSGILDCGNVVAGDLVTKQFTVVNLSKFAVDVVISRTRCVGLSGFAQAALIERTASGQPIFLYRPENANIAPGASQVIDVLFRPDRERFEPFREDLEVRVGTTDEMLRVSFFGRCWGRQLFVTPSDPTTEPFGAHRHTLPGAYVEDVPSSSQNIAPEARSSVHDTITSFNGQAPAYPPIVLEYPDPYAEDVTESSYVSVDGGAGGKGKGATVAGRQQSRKLLVCSTKIFDGRAGAGQGTYEIALSQAAQDSGLFEIKGEKGNVGIGAEISVDMLCTLPQPNPIGGMNIGSWRTFEATVTLKGGWVPAKQPDEVKIPITLRAFVCL